MNKAISISIIIYRKLKSILWFNTILKDYNDKYNNLRPLQLYNNYFNNNREFTYLHDILEDNIYYHIKDIQGVESVINKAKFDGILKYVKK